MNLMIFCEVAEKLVGVSAEDLVDEIEDDDEWYTLPDEIEDLIGSTHTFQVFDKHCDGNFSVMSIMDHVSVPAHAATATQCKEEPAPEGSVDAAAAIRTPATTQFKEEPVSEGGSESDSTEESVSEGGSDSTEESVSEGDSDSTEEPVSDNSGNAAVPTPSTTQCKGELASAGRDNTAAPTPATTKCKEEPVSEGSGIAALLTPTVQCKEEPIPEGRDIAALLTPTTIQCKEEPVPEGSGIAAFLTPTTIQCKEEPAPEGSVDVAGGRSKSPRLQKPNKRLRGNDWIN
jgi:hypothetical protein